MTVVDRFQTRIKKDLIFYWLIINKPQPNLYFGIALASHGDILLACHIISPPQRTSAEISHY